MRDAELSSNNAIEDERLSAMGHFDAIGQSPAFLDFQERLGRAAPVERSILLMGERGTGKEMAAQRLHYLSKRWGQPLVTLNCAALSPSLIESELFGHEAGAFTGARQRRIGRFEAADGGTLFLDEISLIPIETQEKILRVVEYGAFERVGGSRPIQADVRLIGATNVDLAAAARAGKFKSDLLDRLSFEVLFLPPLRARGEDIMLLSHHFAHRMSFELGRQGEPPEFSPEAVESLHDWHWPGNVRELKNVVERAVYRSDTGLIEEIDFDPFHSPYPLPVEPGAEPDEAVASALGVREMATAADSARVAPADSGDGLDLQEATCRLEIDYTRRAMKKARFNQRAAAQLLGLTYHQFRGLYRKYSDKLQN